VRHSFVTLFLGAALSGCTIPVPAVDPQKTIAAAIPAAGAIEFRTEGGPIDEGLADPAALTLPEAIRRALQTGPELQAALARVATARAEAAEAGMPPDPVLDVVLRFPASGGPLKVDAGLATGIVSLLRTPRLASAAHNRLRAEASRALTTALDVLLDVQTHYTAVQALEAFRVVLDERRAIVERQHEVAVARLGAGEGTRTDVVALQADRLSLEIETTERLGELRQERLALARLIGEPSSAAAWSVDPLAPPASDIGAEADWIAAALRSRPEIQVVEWELLAVGDDLALASGSPFESATLGIEAEKDGEWSVGPGLSTPLPLFGRSQARQDAALGRQLEGRHRLTTVQRSTVEEVRSALAVLQLSAGNLDRLRAELIPLLQQRRADVQRAFDERELDVTALLVVDQALLESRTRLIDLERQTAMATFRLQRAVGGPADFDRTRGTARTGEPDHE